MTDFTESIQNLIDLSTKVGELRARHSSFVPMPNELYKAMQEVIELRTELIKQFGAVEAECLSSCVVAKFIVGIKGDEDNAKV